MFDELSAQLNLTRQPKGKRPHLKHVLKPKPHAKKGESQALRAAVQPTTSTGWESEKRPTVSHYLNELLGRKFKKGESQAQRAAVQPTTSTGWKSEKRWIPGTAGSCSTNDIDWVRTWKKANCFTLLKRITKLKSVNSEIRSNVKGYSLDRDSPKGSCHLVEPTWVTHLYRNDFRILIWNVSCVQKPNKTDTMKQMSIYI